MTLLQKFCILANRIMSQFRKYPIKESISFRKTNEVFGGLSNMSSGYSLNVNGILIPTAEHLYQACRFPDYPEIQEAIILESSPMNAKSISRKYNHLTREDWENVRIKIMRWCLQIKLSQNWDKFSSLLIQTGDKNIVEYTQKDKLWGATLDGDFYIGVNALGRLLMEVREVFVKNNVQPYCVEPLNLKLFKLFSEEIQVVCNDAYMLEVLYSNSDEFELI